jgi:hypothetical protein
VVPFQSGPLHVVAGWIARSFKGIKPASRASRHQPVDRLRPILGLHHRMVAMPLIHEWMTCR